jgi:tRNA(Arg) A34 adenosine deaminase TadA
MKVVNRHLEVLTKMAQSIEDPSGGARITAMIAKGNRVIAFGRNQKKTHPFHARYRKNIDAVELHAETHAIQNALHQISSRDLRKCTLYVVRVKRPGPQSDEWIWGNARPCDGCMRCIAQFGITNVVYTTDEDGKYATL